MQQLAVAVVAIVALFVVAEVQNFQLASHVEQQMIKPYLYVGLPLQLPPRLRDAVLILVQKGQH